MGHELFCEAWVQRKANPRSALVIGIAAAETAFKECVLNLNPQARWLVENWQSPPLIKMLQEFLITLPVKQKVRGKVMPPPQNIIEILRKGNRMRNDLVHGKKSSVKEDSLEEILRAIRDLLYLLDYYSGFTWAFNNISPITAKALIDGTEKAK